MLPTPETPLSLGISEIPDYSQALEFAQSLQAIGGNENNHDTLMFGSPSIASTTPATTAMANDMPGSLDRTHQQHQALYTENGVGFNNKPVVEKPSPRRTQLLPQTAPKSVDKKWKTRSQRKKHQGQKKKTKKAIASAMKSTFPPTAFGKQGQGAKLGQHAETSVKNDKSNFLPFDPSGDLLVQDVTNFGVKKKKK
jgi:hypothetical protein